jgi:hypothetical protein
MASPLEIRDSDRELRDDLWGPKREVLPLRQTDACGMNNGNTP